jgi:hypothetical protein
LLEDPDSQDVIEAEAESDGYDTVLSGLFDILELREGDPLDESELYCEPDELGDTVIKELADKLGELEEEGLLDAIDV